MMNYIYPFILAMHSLWRWEVLIILAISLSTFFYKKKQQLLFSPIDQFLVKTTVISFYIQLVLGINLYILSPITQYFLRHFDEAVHLRQIRFFSMEHSSMMIMAAICLTLGAHKSKNADTNDRRFKTLLIWFGLALLIILSSIPWEFSPLTSRPSFRSF
ncbi:MULTISPECIES: hypothetical protein [Sphingobacterium]|uniref:Uncharacterized protein n=1 Tax=Sphingobacterium multivorum TaxID=28454 RepID=A0A2X2JFD4_SPHMU|nr:MULTISPECIES: hypothetical protein [Sphingobacterium]HAF36456.1 hypothetical protein [Sphingobacterium sp.]OFV11564.1 hypothetical protein HMPREF3127_18630 [Sphingobacterium sp. HMSC13C05]QRQ62637.1 hypothetical protein I6J33_06595 [Sphingobacterium multivorum]SPZ93047.1 Uncharacterised protein [Sphingobacterium multivorum]HAL54277.1 hypothetical protein [Sphingobacterium sp.]